MKKLFVLLFLFTLVWGCVENPFVDPVADNNSETIVVEKEYQWLDMPVNSKNQRMIQTEVSVSELILGSKGGKLKVKHEVKNDNELGDFKMTSELKVPKHAFADDEELLFTMTLDDETTTVTFQPHPYTFFLPLELDLEYKGIDVSDFDIEEIKFAYIAEDGTIQLADCDDIEVDKKKHKIKVKKALIPHFSRFGFVR